MTDWRAKGLAAAIADHGDNCSRMAIPECAPAILAVFPVALDAEAIRAEYQRFYDFVADCDMAIVDAWHFSENARVFSKPADA